MSQVAARPTGAIGRMSVVAAAHVALVFVIANGFGLMPTAKKAVPIEGRFYEPEVVNEDPPKPLGPGDLTNQEAFIPAPDNPNYEADDEGAISAPLKNIDEIPTGSARVVPEIPAVAARVDPKHPLTRPSYPAEAIKGELEGAVVVEVLVQTNGRIGDARIVTSSGYEAFDRATLDEARRNWRMLPATRNGEAFAQWYRTRVVFKLTQR